MADPGGLVAEQRLVDAVLVGIVLALKIGAVTPGDVAVKERAVAFFNMLFHPRARELFARFLAQRLQRSPAIAVGDRRAGDVDHAHGGPVGLDIVHIAAILHAPGKEDHVFAYPLVERGPVRGIRILRLDRHQCAGNRVRAAADLNKERARVIGENARPNQLGARRILGHVRLGFYVADNRDLPQCLGARIVRIMDDQVGIDLGIGVQKIVHPVGTHPAVWLDRLAVPAVVELGAGLDDALKIEVVGIEQRVDERVHVVHLTVLGDKQARLALKGGQGRVRAGKSKGRNKAEQHRRTEQIRQDFFHTVDLPI